MPEKVRLVSDPVLRKVCTDVNTVDTLFISGLLETMYETMKAEGGIGLAANQIGISVRVFILKTEDGYKEYLNPEITAASGLVDFDGEACLSIPGASGRTKRYRVISMLYQDKNGIKQCQHFTDMQAFAVQHEMDHLNGKLYIDQFGPVKRELLLNKHKKFLKRGEV